MAELDYAKLVKWVKSNPEGSQKAAAEAQGLTIGQVSMLRFCEAKVEAGIVDEIGEGIPALRKAREDGDRWEMIAARSGLSVSAVKDKIGEVAVKTKPKKESTAKASPKAKGAATRPTGKTTGGKRIQRNRTRRGSRNPS